MNGLQFDESYLAYRDALWRFAYGFVRDSGAAEDIVQDVFVSLWERRNDLELKHSLKVWLYAAVRNRALNFIRHTNVMNNIGSGEDDEIPGHSVHFSGSVLDELEHAQLKEFIDRTLSSMPPRRRAMFELRYREELTFAEIADVFGVSIAAVHKSVTAAESGLRPLLEKFYREG